MNALINFVSTIGAQRMALIVISTGLLTIGLFMYFQ